MWTDQQGQRDEFDDVDETRIYLICNLISNNNFNCARKQ